MKSTFRVNPELTVEVDSNKIDGLVSLTSWVGVEFEKRLDERSPTTVFQLSKAEARGIASAMMGCASEV